MNKYPRRGTLARDIADAYHAVWCGPNHEANCGAKFHACQGTIDPASLAAILKAVEGRQA